MAVQTNPLMVEIEDQSVIAQAADIGFRLVSYETASGHLAWEWQRGDEPRPQFTNRRVAVHWMEEFLAHDGRLAFVSEAGQSYS
ncbi:MAG TPA: hypothetical protein VIA11_24450 [Acidimicrobiia bacterium]|jgi:hypothetical protein|nr:hypothetical protein [Acidimicrobiia bacterium]